MSNRSETQGDADDCMYSWRVRGIEAALAERGVSEGSLTVQQLTELGHLDQYHYYGTDACDEAISVLGLDDERHVLDVGSGIGGPARYLAAETGCAVQGVEIRSELVEAARDLTERTGLDDRVQFTAGSINNADLATGEYDHLIAWLVLLHLTDRQAALSKCLAALRPGGTAFVEAFVTDDPSTENLRRLQEVVEVPDPVSEQALRDQFQTAGFEDVVTCELTEAWTRWTAVRYERFRSRREQFIDLHGRETYDRRAEFYQTVRDLFADGAVRGVGSPHEHPVQMDRRCLIVHRRHSLNATLRQCSKGPDTPYHAPTLNSISHSGPTAVGGGCVSVATQRRPRVLTDTSYRERDWAAHGIGDDGSYRGHGVSTRTAGSSSKAEKNIPQSRGSVQIRGRELCQ